MAEVTSKRNRCKVEHDGHLFCFDKNSKDGAVKSWRCDQRDSNECKARLHTSAADNAVIKLVNDHNHGIDPARVPASLAREDRKGLAERTNEAPTVRIDSVEPRPSAAVRGTLAEAVRKIIQRKLTAVHASPPAPLPADRASPVVPVTPGTDQANEAASEKVLLHDSGDAWKKKWTSLRDTFTRKKKENAKAGPASLQKKKWVFYDMMSFMDEYVSLRGPDCNFSDIQDQDSYVYEPSVWSVQYDDDNQPASDDRGDSHSPFSPVSGGRDRDRDAPPPLPQASSWTPPPFLPGRKRGRGSGDPQEPPDSDSSFQAIVEEVKRIRREAAADSRCQEERDPDGDDAFFQSCCRRMRKFSARTRSFLKLQITQLFFNAENPALQPLPITPLLPQTAAATVAPVGRQPSPNRGPRLGGGGGVCGPDRAHGTPSATATSGACADNAADSDENTAVEPKCEVETKCVPGLW